MLSLHDPWPPSPGEKSGSQSTHSLFVTFSTPVNSHSIFVVIVCLLAQYHIFLFLFALRSTSHTHTNLHASCHTSSQPMFHVLTLYTTRQRSNVLQLDCLLFSAPLIIQCCPLNFHHHVSSMLVWCSGHQKACLFAFLFTHITI